MYNASGPRTGSHAALHKIGASASGAVLSKSATVLAQDGNPLPRYKELEMGAGRAPLSINSEGLPNKGIDCACSSVCVSVHDCAVVDVACCIFLGRPHPFVV